jgi:signal transduction histidine kinase
MTGRDLLLVPLLVTVFVVAMTGPRRLSYLVGGLLAGTALAVAALTRDSGPVDGVPLIVAAVAAGVALRESRRSAAQARLNAEGAEQQGRAEADRRVAEERLRIARDLHDVIAHSVAAIGAQAGAAGHLLQVVDDPKADRAFLTRTVESIDGICRQTSGELRAVLGVLRDV